MRDGVVGLLSRRVSSHRDGLVSAANARSRAFWLSRSFSDDAFVDRICFGISHELNSATEHAQERYAGKKTRTTVKRLDLIGIT